MTAESRGNVIILDADQKVLDELVRNLETRLYEVTGCRTGKEALAVFKQKNFDLLITEWRLDGEEGLDGFQVMEAMGKMDPQLAVVVLTGFPDVDSAVKAMKMGARDYLKKPVGAEQIIEVVDQAIMNRRDLLAKQDRLAVFEELKRKIASSLNLREVLDLIVAGLVKGMGLGIKGCTINLLDKKKDRLKVVAHQGLSRQYLEKGPIASSRSIGEMILRGEYVWIKDAVQDSRIQYPEEAKKEGIASVLSIPMLIKDQVMGALRIYTATPRKFTPEEIRFLHRFAEQAALAIENARKYEDMKNKYETLRTDLVDFFDDGWT